MIKKFFIGFKGKNNTSCILVKSMSENSCLLTNSFGGLKKDIEMLDDFYDYILMFGIDKTLNDTVRIEQSAEREQIKLYSALDLWDISDQLNKFGVKNYISDKPTHYLCNEAYWYVLKKYNGKSAFIHIPSIRNTDEHFIEKIKTALS